AAQLAIILILILLLILLIILISVLILIFCVFDLRTRYDFPSRGSFVPISGGTGSSSSPRLSGWFRRFASRSWILRSPRRNHRVMNAIVTPIASRPAITAIRMSLENGVRSTTVGVGSTYTVGPIKSTVSLYAFSA